MSDAEAPAVSRTETLQARKPHKCCECDGKIQPKELYEKCTGYWDRWQTYKTCSDCASLRKDIEATLRWDDYPAFGELCDYVFESRDNLAWVQRYVETRHKRGRGNSPNLWMEIFLESLQAEETQKPGQL